MRLDDEIAKKDSLLNQYSNLESELKTIEDSFDFTSLEAKKSELFLKVEELQIPIAAKAYKEAVAKYSKMPKDNTYEYRHVVEVIRKYEPILLKAGVITKGVL